MGGLWGKNPQPKIEGGGWARLVKFFHSDVPTKKQKISGGNESTGP